MEDEVIKIDIFGRQEYFYDGQHYRKRHGEPTWRKALEARHARISDIPPSNSNCTARYQLPATQTANAFPFRVTGETVLEHHVGKLIVIGSTATRR